MYFYDSSAMFGLQELIVFYSVLEKNFGFEYGWSVTEESHVLNMDERGDVDMIDCLFVNPPFNRHSVDYQKDASLARFQMDAINPGIIALYSYLKDKGMVSEIIDFYRNHNMEDVKREIDETIKKFRPVVVSISNSSAYDYIDTVELIEWISSNYSEVSVVVGGQHASNLKTIIFDECKNLKFLLQGEGEYALYELITSIKNGKKSNLGTSNLWERVESGKIIKPYQIAKPFDLNQGSPIDLSVYPEAITFTPFVEESRACPYACRFCDNNEFYGSTVRVKSPYKFEKDLEKAVVFFGTKPMYAILTSDLDYRTAKEKAFIIKKYNILWSSQMDCIHDWSALVPVFRESGMKLLNLGLESGSPRMLRMMGKSQNPQKYLENCKHILKTCHEYDILTRVNILIYPGENEESIKETLTFLDSVSPWLQGVVACVTVAYPGSKLMQDMEVYEEEYGAKFIDTPQCKATHHYPIQPSAMISFEKATEIALDIEERYSRTRILSQKHNYKKYEGELF